MEVDGKREKRSLGRIPSMAAMRAIETNDFAGASIRLIVPLKNSPARAAFR